MLKTYREVYHYDSNEFTAGQLIGTLSRAANRYGYEIHFETCNHRKHIRTLIAFITCDSDKHSDWFVNVICPMEYDGTFTDISWDYA